MDIHFSKEIARYVFLLGSYLAFVFVFLQSYVVLAENAFELELRPWGRGRDITARVFFATPILVLYLRVGLLGRGRRNRKRCGIIFCYRTSAIEAQSLNKFFGEFCYFLSCIAPSN
jgi:hypothetical protein